jgi:hypothetical protein
METSGDPVPPLLVEVVMPYVRGIAYAGRIVGTLVLEGASVPNCGTLGKSRHGLARRVDLQPLVGRITAADRETAVPRPQV